MDELLDVGGGKRRRGSKCVCNFCGKVARDNYNLKRHMASHISKKGTGCLKTQSRLWDIFFKLFHISDLLKKKLGIQHINSKSYWQLKIWIFMHVNNSFVVVNYNYNFITISNYTWLHSHTFPRKVQGVLKTVFAYF